MTSVSPREGGRGRFRKRRPRPPNVVVSAREEIRDAAAAVPEPPPTLPLTARPWCHWPVKNVRGGEDRHWGARARQQRWNNSLAPAGRHPNGPLRGGVAEGAAGSSNVPGAALNTIPQARRGAVLPSSSGGEDTQLMKRIKRRLDEANSIELQGRLDIVRCAGLAAGADSFVNKLGGRGDPYAVVFWNGEEVGRTSVKANVTDPRWDYSLLLRYDRHRVNELRVEVWDYDRKSEDEFLGQVTVKGEGLTALPPKPDALALRPHPSPQISSQYVQGRIYLCCSREPHKLGHAAAGEGESSEEDDADARRLRAYGQCWDELSNALTIYRPLMTTIKGTYERFMGQLDKELLALKPTATAHDALESDRERKREAAQLECDRMLVQLRQDVRDERERKKQLEQQVRQVLVDLKNMKYELDETCELELNLHSINKFLCSKITHSQQLINNTAAMEASEGDNIDFYTTRLDTLQNELDEIEDAVMVATRRLDEYEVQLKRKSNERGKLSAKHGELKTALAVAEAARTTVKEQYRATRRKVGQLQRVILDAKMGKRPLTPRPDWSKIKTMVDQGVIGSDLNLSQPSGLVIQELLDSIDTMHMELQAVLETLPWVKDAKKRDAALANKWFVCLGTGPQVPKFLRLQGKVRNRSMGKAECETFIQEFWEARTKAVAKQSYDSFKTAAEFLYSYLRGRFGVPTAIAEYAYNLMDALKRYAYDADCELFAKIINGEICEEAYADQVKTVDGLLEAFRKTEGRRPGVNKSKLRGQLQREDLRKALKSFFPFKNEDELQPLYQAVLYDQPLPTVRYEKLFESDANGDQGKFAETLRDQHLAAILQSYTAIEEAISARALEQLRASKSRAPPGGSGLIASVKMIREALKKYDPAMPSVETTRILAVGLGLTIDEAPFSDFRKVEVELFIQRLRGTLVPRWSPPPEESFEGKQLKALRQLMPHERMMLEEAFAAMDTDYSGTLTEQELTEVLVQVYAPGGNEKARQMYRPLFRIFDTDGNGDISFDEFLRGILCAPELQFISVIFKWRDAFTRYDADHSGAVDHAELHELLTDINGASDEANADVLDDANAEVLQMFASVEHEGLISWKAFLTVMQQLNPAGRPPTLE
jgi:Ca2+-binding EF-hand superfamily protein